jgi:hypothetical protein
MSEIKTLSKGEFLYKENDKISQLYLIQSGSLNLCLIKEKKIIDLNMVGPSQILGESALFGSTYYHSSAMAVTETKVISIPLEAVRGQMETLPQVFKILLKSLNDRVKNFSQEIKGYRLEKNEIPCPEEHIPKLFASFYFALIQKGIPLEKKDSLSLKQNSLQESFLNQSSLNYNSLNPNSFNRSTSKQDSSKTTLLNQLEFPETLKVSWPLFKTYLHKVFNEQPKRIENTLFILKKLNLAQLHYGPPPEDPEGPSTLLEAEIKKPDLLQNFFEFYQYYYFKPGKSDLLKFDDFAVQILEILLLQGKDLPRNRFGAVQVSFHTVKDHIKDSLQISFGSDHLTRLESKGVLLKRTTLENQEAALEYLPQDLEHLLFSWKIIHEIDKWNQKGFVDLEEKKPEKDHKTLSKTCPQCQTPITTDYKFCPSCGLNLT